MRWMVEWSNVCPPNGMFAGENGQMQMRRRTKWVIGIPLSFENDGLRWFHLMLTESHIDEAATPANNNNNSHLTNRLLSIRQNRKKTKRSMKWRRCEPSKIARHTILMHKINIFHLSGSGLTFAKMLVRIGDWKRDNPSRLSEHLQTKMFAFHF